MPANLYLLYIIRNQNFFKAAANFSNRHFSSKSPTGTCVWYEYGLKIRPLLSASIINAKDMDEM